MYFHRPLHLNKTASTDGDNTCVAVKTKQNIKPELKRICVNINAITYFLKVSLRNERTNIFLLSLK